MPETSAIAVRDPARVRITQQYAEFDLASVPDAKDYVVIAHDGSCSSESQRLYELKAVNLLIGPNNAGKSRLLRASYNTPSYRYRPSGVDRNLVIKAVKKLETEIRDRLTGNLIGFGPIRDKNALTRFTELDWFTEGEDRVDELRTFLTALIRLQNFNPTYSGIGPPHESEVRQVHATLIPSVQELLSAIDNSSLAIGSEHRVYVPVLRGLRPVGDAAGDYYADRTQRDYTFTFQRGTVFTGQLLYGHLRNLLLGSRAERESVREYEEFLGQELFDGNIVELIPRREKDVVYLRVGTDEERPIYDLGDGFQALITITFLPFTAGQRSLFFIEELDTHMHPGMQRKLLEVLLRNQRLARHQYFATTHSNHFLDMAADYADCTTLLVRKATSTPTTRFTITPVGPGERLILEELGARCSSVFLTNATVWVEGVTDRLYLREYLARYLRDRSVAAAPREDTHYSFMESGGANIAHFDFSQASAVEELTMKIRVARVCSRSFVVLDGDNQGKPRLAALEKQLGTSIFVLRGKEVENLLPIDVLREYVRRRIPNCDPSHLQLEDYHEKNRALGRVLDEKFATGIFADGQTIKNKNGLCEFAVGFMRESDAWQLSPEAIRLCEQLLAFINAANTV